MGVIFYEAFFSLTFEKNPPQATLRFFKCILGNFKYEYYENFTRYFCFLSK